MIGFFIGLLIGAFLGICVMAVLNMAGRDEWP